jgi:hypothetical protein
MNSLLQRRLAILLAVAFALSPLLFSWAGEAKKLKSEYFKGNVVPLAEAVKKFGVKLDKDAAAVSLVLVSENNKIYPLLKDDGSRMFFKDETLLKRPMRLTAREIPGSNLLQVVNVHSYRKGQLHELYYWCDICSIKRFEKGPCDCCGAPLVLREVPADE